jgi:hypothetical protein
MEVTGKTPCLPVVLGVTGHRDPRLQDQEALKKAVGLVIRGLKEGPAAEYLVLASALAEGADQLAAEVALDLEPIPLVAIVPMPLQEYEKTFETKEGKRRLHDMWARAALRIELPQVRVEGETPSNEAQFEQLGLVLSRYSHVLLALWDGIDGGPQRARGGTAQIVAMRRLGERVVASAGFRASALFAGAPPLLELTRSGPVVQIYTPRLSKERGGEYQFGMSHEPGAVLGLLDAISSAKVSIKSPADLTGATEENFASFALAQKDFVQIAQANCDMSGVATKFPGLCTSHEGYLFSAELELSQPLNALRCLQARADVTAAAFQRRIIGEWAPGLPWKDGLKLARAREARFPQLSVLLLFALALPLAVLFYEGYAHLGWAVWGLVAYMAIFAGAYLFYLLVVKRRGWQERFQDYRALAEALRVQFYWAACGFPVAVSDNYLRQHADDLGWIRQALRGPALFGIAAALAPITLKNRRATFAYWTKDQHDFFVGADGETGKAKINHRAKERIDRLVHLILIITAIAALSALALDFQHIIDHADVRHHLLVIAIGLLPAIAASLIFIGESRAYEAHARSYARAGLLQRSASEIAAEMQNKPVTEDWRALVLELGQEALAENARWLTNHRERRVSSRVG